MSEENEHTSEENETEMNAENHCSGEQSKSDNSMLNNETGQLMLEDEEMPTYISVSTPSRREDLDVNNTKQQDRIPMEEDHSRSAYPSDDQGGGSIYVLSSGEESNHPYNDEEEEDYVDSEEMDEIDRENYHENLMLEDEEDEDEEDDEDENHLRLHHHDDDEDIETEYDQDCYDRASDDFILNSRQKQYPKERSLSLQDLSFTKNNKHSPYNIKNRHSINLFGQNYVGLQQNSIAYNVAHKRQSLPLKYQHVESKVKRYIRDIKEQSRKSMEKRIKEQEYVAHKNHEENENETDPLKLTVTNKVIKGYAEKAIKDLQREENNENGNSIYNSAQILENGGNNKLDIKVTETQLKQIRRNSDMNAFGDIQNEKRAQNCNDKLEKRNGSVDVNAHHIEYQNTLDRNVKLNNMDQPSLVNGHQQAPTVFDLRSLTYEEYVHGISAEFEQKEETIEQRHKTQEKIIQPETYNDTEMVNVQEMENSNTGCPLKIANVKSIRVVQEEQENFTKTNLAETVEVMQLKAQLNQKDAQFNSLRNAYQKTVAENMKMKQELDTLRKSIAKYESESKTSETKIASVQTESIAEPVSVPKVVVTTVATNNKVSTSSVASTVSSLDQWADSAASSAISIKPPDLTPILNSDDSLVLTNGTPSKLPHPLSRTFITSSRILQTLSNITQGRTSKVESSLVRNNKTRVNENSMNQLLNLEYNRSATHVSTSKKRKATEMLDTSTFVQPFKIPHTSTESEKKSASTSNADLKYSEDQSSVKADQQSMNKDSEDPSSMDIQTEIAANQDDGDVKFFVYRDNENSKNKSFLIQAEEPTKDILENEKHRIQECGPYLLGNLEVRMSEINGTISVWGKEINQEPTSDNEDDMEVSVKSTNKRTSLYSQKSPQIRFNGSPLVCSTQKKLKLPLRQNRSNDSQCCHSMSPNIVKSPYLLDEANDKRFESNRTHASNCSSACENCDSIKHRREWPSYKASSSSQEKSHSCCTHHAEFVEKDCNCGSYHERQMHDDSPNHSKDKFHVKGIRRSSWKNAFTPESSKHLRENIANSEISDAVYKYNKSCRHSVQNASNSSSHSTKCCNNIRDFACACKSSSSNMHSHNCSERQTCSHSSSHEGEEDPLIPPKRSNETPETRQRRSSGKRVRGILMDLLKGCGDCRSTNGNTVNKTGLQLKEPVCMKNGPPQIKISSCLTPEPSYSSSTQCNERCCHAYARRIESQLEEFRTEMERVRSRSDAILDMLNMIHSVDMN